MTKVRQKISTVVDRKKLSCYLDAHEHGNIVSCITAHMMHQQNSTVCSYQSHKRSITFQKHMSIVLRAASGRF